MATANADDKFHALDLTPTLAEPTLWVVVIGGFFATMINAGTDQTFVQRYLTTKTEKAAAKSVWTFGLMAIPAAVIFFGLGSALYVFFKTNPGALDPGLSNPDAIFPWYIVTQLPPGFAGLLIAGLFAAAMSSLDSSMNSSATVLTTDFYRRFRPEVEDHKALRFARWVTVIVGVAGTAFALMMATWEIKSLWDEFQSLVGLVAGGLGGLFLLGIVSRRANSTGALVGLIGSGVAQYFVRAHQPVHLLLFTMTGVCSCMAIGYVVSLIVGGRPEALAGLTVHDRGKERADE